MNQVNIVKKRANKYKKKNYYLTDKNENNPYSIQGRVTLPFNFLQPNAVNKAIQGSNDGNKWNEKKPSNRVTVNYTNITDYYIKTLKEKPKSIAQNDDCSIFKEIDRLFHNKFESKTIPNEPKRSQFCLNLRKQLKGIRVENFRTSSVRKIRNLIASDEPDELSEDDADNPQQTTHRDIVACRNAYENIPGIPSYKFVFTTPVNRRLNFVTQIDISGLHFTNPTNTMLTFSPLCTININSSILDVGKFLLEPKKRMEKLYFTPPESCNFGEVSNFSTLQIFQKRATTPVIQEYKRSKVFFTPPETFFDFNFKKSPIFQFGREQAGRIGHYGENDLFVEPPQNLFENQFVSPIFAKNYFDLD